MLIRHLSPHDSSAYTALWVDALNSQDECFRISIHDEPAPQIQTTFTLGSFTLGAFECDNLMGTVSLQRDSRLKHQHKALLFRMYIHPQAAGKGIGNLLVTETLLQAQKLTELRQVYLTVLANNLRAQHLYKKLGFVEFAREPQAVKIKQTYIDELQMVKIFEGVH
jgi:ribosomal protein S18 acetylase RimI-like enzyme